jgi:uncharacterized protein (DUF934 family)
MHAKYETHAVNQKVGFDTFLAKNTKVQKETGQSMAGISVYPMHYPPRQSRDLRLTQS